MLLAERFSKRERPVRKNHVVRPLRAESQWLIGVVFFENGDVTE